MSEKNLKIYLGDGAYATHLGHAVLVTTENGIAVQNAVYLELDMIEKLLKFAKGEIR